MSEIRGSMAWNRDVVPHVFRMNLFADTYRLLSLGQKIEEGVTNLSG